MIPGSHSDWLSRKNSCSVRALHLKNALDAQPQLSKLLECYLAFFEAQFSYLYDGFFVSKKFKVSDEYPPDHVMQVTVDQAKEDLDVIERIIFQRVCFPDHKRMSTLIKADYLVTEALKPAAGLFENFPIALTYFQKSTSIRIVPYANVALIGLPLSILELPKDLLAIPHEVGHYVYWHGKNVRNKSLVDNSGANLALKDVATRIYPGDPKDREVIRVAGVYNWQEEIFADVYGSQVAGPLLAMDFQDHLLENSQDGIEEDDSDHPIPSYRPYIYAYALEDSRSLHAPTMAPTGWSAQLNTSWSGKIAGRALRDRNKYTLAVKPEKFLAGSIDMPEKVDSVAKRLKRSSSSSREFTKAELDVEIQPVIDKILTTRLNGLDFVNTAWGTFIRAQAQPGLNGLYQNFHTFINNLQVTASTDVVVGNDWAELKQTWINDWPTADPDLGEWLPVFKAAGWTVQGPSTPHTPPPNVA